MLMRGDPFIAIDNCDRPLEGALLNQMLTQQQVELRVLGFSKMVTAMTSALVTATGNNLVLLGDLTRRGVVAASTPRSRAPSFAPSTTTRSPTPRGTGANWLSRR